MPDPTEVIYTAMTAQGGRARDEHELARIVTAALQDAALLSAPTPPPCRSLWQDATSQLELRAWLCSLTDGHTDPHTNTTAAATWTTDQQVGTLLP